MTDRKPTLNKDKNTSKRTHSSSREWFEALIYAAIAATIIRTFIIEAYRIPTGSMEDTLLAGDFLFVNKFIYGAMVPFTDWRLPKYKDVQVGDIVVFKFPKEEDVNYIKRCVAGPGDVFELRNKEVYVNETLQPLPPDGKYLSGAKPKGQPDINIFPRYSRFNRDQYGPITIPKEGETIELNRKNFNLYRDIFYYEGHEATLMGNTVAIDGAVSKIYTVKQDYYFMMGDNRDNSLDSRYWGFLPASHVVGSALIIFWSWDPNIGLLNIFDKVASIRWDRPGMLIE